MPGPRYVLSPKHMTGRMLARHGFVNADVEVVADAAASDMIYDRSLHHGQELVLVKTPVLRGSPAVDRTLAEIGFFSKYGVEPLILWRAGEFTLFPAAMPWSMRRDALPARPGRGYRGRRRAASSGCRAKETGAP